MTSLWTGGSRKASSADTTRIRFNLHTWSWIGLCCTMGYAGAVQGNGAAYLLAFLTGTLGVMSLVYARRNLRGLAVRVGVSSVQRAGIGEALAVELEAVSGHSPCGIEVLLVGNSRATFVEQIPSGDSVRLYLRMPAGDAPLRLLLRSAYPLGLFHAQRLVHVELTRRAIPTASGNLPLPATRHEQPGGNDGRAGSSSTPSREGDDFAGVREWQIGDSPKHIDWRAVARGRPLLVKTWAKGGQEAVEIDWNQVPLPEAARAGQIVRWIQMCEQQGIAYSLKLPGKEFTTGQGESHARRCLEALADIHSGGLDAAETTRKAKIPPSYEHRAEVPPKPLALLSSVVFLTTLFLQDFVPWFCLILLFICLCVRTWLASSMTKRWIPLTVIAGGVAVLFGYLGNLLSMEAGIAVLVILLGGKLLESKSPHDFQVIAMMGWFLCLCGLLTDQGIARAVFMFSFFIVICGCMVRFRRGVSGASVPVKLTGRLMLQALPVVVLLFLVFPRVSLDYLARLGSARTAVTGVTSSLDPGKVLQIARSTETAFRVEFPQGVVPPNSERYWRCVVLWGCDGLSWSRGMGVSVLPRMRDATLADLRQLITLEPHGQAWLPSLDYPVAYEDGQGVMGISMERVLAANDNVRKMRRFEVMSRLRWNDNRLPESHRQAALLLPRNLSPRLRELAESWHASAKTDVDIVQAGLNHLRTQGFKYTLEPGTYLGPGALEDFMFNRKVGFCEHFSASFATLMRAAGVPSRVVLGYLGGEMSMTASHMIVRQSDAHAWTEVWLNGTGWTRIDPTAALAPDRVNMDLRSYLLGGDEAMERERNSLVYQALQQAKLFWDQVNYQWFNMIVNFDDESQFSWLSALGLKRVNQTMLFIISVFLVLLALGLLTVWLRRPAYDPDPWRRAWRQFCRHLEGLGLPARRESEGPMAYARRIAGSRQDIQDLARRYVDARYGGTQTSIKEFEKAVRALR